MRISDWSSDVCSSDLRLYRIAGAIELDGRIKQERHGFADQPHLRAHAVRPPLGLAQIHVEARSETAAKHFIGGDEGQRIVEAGPAKRLAAKIGRASCRARVGQYV